MTVFGFLLKKLLYNNNQFFIYCNTVSLNVQLHCQNCLEFLNEREILRLKSNKCHEHLLLIRPYVMTNIMG